MALMNIMCGERGGTMGLPSREVNVLWSHDSRKLRLPLSTLTFVSFLHKQTKGQSFKTT